jgi:chemotaxis protein methyltransferase CheR
MSPALNALAQMIRNAAGLRLEPSGYHALRAALARAWPGLPHAEVLRRARDPLTGASTVAVLVDEITIKETSFLRDRRQLDSIDWHGLHARALAGGSPVVRVWSAACATGEEPYSLALLACEAFGSTTPPVRILATDVSFSALASAAAGHYRARAVQTVEEAFRVRYFERATSHYTVVPALRALVTLAPHNLVADPFPPLGETPFHLLLCRNVLIYFDGKTCAGVAAGLERSLARGGRLMLGAADALCVLDRAVGELDRKPPRSARPPERPRRAAPAATPHSKQDPLSGELMDPVVHYLHGLDALESGNPLAAVSSLRRVLYLDPEFELAAFALGRAHEEAGEPDAARRRYLQAIRMLGERAEPGERLSGAIGASTVIDACEARLVALAGGGASRTAALTKHGPR